MSLVHEAAPGVAPAAQRSRIVAGLLSLIAPGVGHLYIGRRKRGLVLLAILLALPATMVAIGILLPPTFLAVGLLGATYLVGYAGLLLFVLIDAIRLARRGEPHQTPWYIYVLSILAVWVGFYLASVLMGVVRTQLPWRIFSIPASSMQPTLMLDEHVLGDMRYFAKHQPARNDVVFYRLPSDNSTIYIKRIVGLPGDRVMFRDGRTILNGVATSEPFADPGDAKAFYNTTAETTVPAGHVFVAGDNRANSTDSRVKQHGMVPVGNLMGRATEIMSSDPDRMAVWVGSPE